MSISNCLDHAMRIQRLPREQWRAELDALPERCTHPDDCGEPRNCRQRNREFLRAQVEIAKYRRAR